MAISPPPVVLGLALTSTILSVDNKGLLLSADGDDDAVSTIRWSVTVLLELDMMFDAVEDKDTSDVVDVGDDDDEGNASVDVGNDDDDDNDSVESAVVTMSSTAHPFSRDTRYSASVTHLS